MIYGVAAGLFFAGLVGGAMTGSILTSIIFIGAAMLIAGAAEAVKLYKEQQAASRYLRQYPPYGY